VKETLVALKMDSAPGMPADDEVIDARKVTARSFI
jgi:hypothetical protein